MSVTRGYTLYEIRPSDYQNSLSDYQTFDRRNVEGLKIDHCIIEYHCIILYHWITSLRLVGTYIPNRAESCQTIRFVRIDENAWTSGRTERFDNGAVGFWCIFFGKYPMHRLVHFHHLSGATDFEKTASIHMTV